MRTITVSILAMALAVCMGLPAAAQSPAVNAIALGELQFPFDGNEQHREYLGIASQSTLSLSQVHAERLIVVIFNTFCTICQADATMLNMAYEVVDQDPILKGRVKMIGIAAGNTAMEVEQFRQSHNVPFPLFSDPDFKMDRAIPKDLRTPILLSVNNAQGEPLRVVKVHTGALKRVEDIFDDLFQRRAALDTPASRN